MFFVNIEALNCGSSSNHKNTVNMLDFVNEFDHSYSAVSMETGLAAALQGVSLQLIRAAPPITRF